MIIFNLTCLLRVRGHLSANPTNHPLRVRGASLLTLSNCACGEPSFRWLAELRQPCSAYCGTGNGLWSLSILNFSGIIIGVRSKNEISRADFNFG